MIEARLPFPTAFAIYPGPLFEAALYGLLAAAIFTLWPIARTEDIRAATLFRDALAAGPLLPAKRYLAANGSPSGPAHRGRHRVFGYLGTPLYTAGGIAGALILLTLAAALARWTARRTQPAPEAARLCGSPSVPSARVEAKQHPSSSPSARSCGAGGRRPDRRQPPPRDPVRPPRHRAQLLLRRHPARPDRRLPRKAGQ